jgi:hypothetical protein
MAEQSTFSRFPNKQLVFIANKLIADNYTYTGEYDDSIYEDNKEILKSVASYFGESYIVEDDVQFFMKFLEVNDELLSKINETNDNSLIENLIIPQSQDFLIEYTADGTCNFIEYHEDTISAYDKRWVYDSVYNQYHSGNWDIFSGVLKNTEYDNWETQNWEIQTVKEISNDISESRKNKRLLENTEKLIPKLDRDTLIALKFLIDKQLRPL